MTDTPLLEIRDLSKTFGSVQALTEVDFEVREGEVMALVGDNGAGKSTLIKCIAGIHGYDSGEIVFDGKPVTIHGPKDAARLGIEFVYQDLALCDNLDVVQNMYLGREERDWLFRLKEPLMEQRTAETLRALAVTTIRSIRQPVASLSGGQRQSVAVAKAVQWNSRLVILDEPTAALGVAQTRQVLELVKRLAEQGLAVVLVSHNLHDIFEVATRITVLRLGRDVGVYDRAVDEHSRRSSPRSPRVSPRRSRGHRDPRRRAVSSGADVVAPGIEAPDWARPSKPDSGSARRATSDPGTSASCRSSSARSSIVAYFAFTATNFFTAANFVNVILQMAGTTMIAFGVVFVLLLGEIDLSIAYVSGIAAVAVAEFQLPSSSHDYPGWLAILLGLAIVAVIGFAQGTVVARIGVPSFVATLAGLLIWQGVILKVLQARDSIIIEDNWINYTATYYFSANVGWLIAAAITGLYGVVALGGVIGLRRAGLSAGTGTAITKFVAVAAVSFGIVAICNHAKRPTACPEGTPLTETCYRPLGLPLAALLMVMFLVGLTYLAKRTAFGRHVYAVGGNAEAARRAGINVPRVRIIVFVISSVMAGVGGIVLAARLQSVNLNQGGGTLLLDAISAAVIGGVSLFGGRGEVRGALLGALVIATIANGLNIGGYSTGTIYVVTGIILLLAVTLDTIARRLQVRAGR